MYFRIWPEGQENLFPSSNDWIENQQLVDKNQLVDFSSTYFEGKKCPLGKRGYSRGDKRDKLQITFGISTGINGIPTMLTVSEGNEQDKIHMKKILKLAQKVCDNGSLFIFDCGGNSNEYWCVKINEGNLFRYIFFSEKLN